LPATNFTASTAAGLLGTASDAGEAQLSRLVAQNLLEARSGEGSDVIHYQMHRLIQFYARERLNHEFVDPETSKLPVGSVVGSGAGRPSTTTKVVEAHSDQATRSAVSWAPSRLLGFS
jgi:hypothetical protein